MAIISSSALKNIMKSKISAISSSSGPIENDALLTAIAESMVLAFNDNIIESSVTGNGGVGDSQVYAESGIPTLAWDAAPTATYEAFNYPGLAQINFTANTTGGWTIGGIGADTGSGRWRPTSENNLSSYEIRVTATGDTVVLSGCLSSLNTWTTMTDVATVTLSDIAAGLKSASITVEIRVRSDTGNTTGVASFTFEADGGKS